jgi:hypothetical protein
MDRQAVVAIIGSIGFLLTAGTVLFVAFQHDLRVGLIVLGLVMWGTAYLFTE